MKRLVLLALASAVFLFAYSKVVFAQDACSGDVTQRISCYENNISKLKDSSKTLANQIAQFDAQIKLTSLKIQQTEDQIEMLTGRIDQLSDSLSELNQAFSQRAIETYKIARIGNPILVLLTSGSLDEAYGTFSYLKRIQDADRSLIERLKNAQTTFEAEKISQEELQLTLENQKKTLDSQKNAKNLLLSQTRNDEKRYQSLLAQALAEKAAIEKALVSGTNVGPVKAGDPIALVGNSGYPSCSTGKHLHFEVRKSGTWVDPGPYMQSKTLIDEERGGSVTLGSGSWQWPIQDPIRLTQHYGQTPYSWRYSYSGGIHTGYDMVSKSSDVIRAPADGNLFKSSEKCGSSTINIVYIDHGGGLMTFYLHVQ